VSKGTLGSFDGAVTPNVNMVEIFRQSELAQNPNSHLKFSAMSIKKIGISTEPDAIVRINDALIPIPSGLFELGFGMLQITKLVFDSQVDAQIHYIY
jgi:hypothetical protein